MQAREIGDNGSVRSRSRAASVNGIPTVGRPASVLTAAPSSFIATILENSASNTGVISSEGEFLPGDGDDPGVRRPALRGDRLDRRPWWWAGGAGAAQAAGLV